MKRILFFLLMIYSSMIFGQADQNNANIWYFGDRAGVDFNSGNPIGITDGQLNTQEGVATVCDKNGNFLFYTDGSTVWDKYHGIMPNGNGTLNGHFSSTQSAIIVPNLSDSSLYYIFTVDELGGPNGLSYSMMDMTLPGNGSMGNPYGDIVDTMLNIPLMSPVCEKITAVLQANEMDYWVIAHGWNNNEFYAFEVTANGVSHTPITTSLGNIHTGGTNNINSVGYMKSSPARDKLALVNRNAAGIDLYDFDYTTGVVSNEISIALPGELLYGVEFSAAGNYLFIGCLDKILRCKIPSIIIDTIGIDDPSPFLVTNSSIRALQLGPDGKIYVSIRYHDYLSVISNPDNVVADLTVDGVFLDTDGQGRDCRFGLPNIFYHKGWTLPSNTKMSGVHKVNAYPNPFNEYLIIETNKKSLVKIRGVDGKVVLIQIIENNSGLNIIELPIGVYIVEVYDYRTNEKQYIEKFIKSP